MRHSIHQILICLLAAILLSVSSAGAVEWDLKGSLGEGEHKHYVPPVSNPFLNETPFITTEARPIIIYNDIPGNVLANTPFAPGTPGGGRINVYTIQLRFALTDRLGVIFNKNGVMDFNHASSNMLSDTGLANLSFGVKYALISDPKQEQLVTAGITYEIPSGTLKADAFRLQGDGNGYINLFVTAAESYNKVGVQAMIGTKITLDQDRLASWFNYSLHMDYEILPNWFPLVEFNGFTPINDPRQNQFNFSGLDLFDVGGADPQPVVTFAAGSRYKISSNVMAGLAYEFPLTGDKDIMDWRVTGDLVFYY